MPVKDMTKTAMAVVDDQPAGSEICETCGSSLSSHDVFCGKYVLFATTYPSLAILTSCSPCNFRRCGTRKKMSPPPRSTTLDSSMPCVDMKIDIDSSLAVQVVFNRLTVDVNTRDKLHPKKRVLDEVSGCLAPGELTAVMGPSGSGKTMLLNALAGTIRISSGSISANDTVCTEPLMRVVHMVLVPQDDLLTPVLTPREALMEVGTLKASLGKHAAQRRADELLATFGLQECRDVRIGYPDGSGSISGGQRKRLSIALELMDSPSLICLDEPTSGLDAVATLSLVHLLSSLANQGANVVATIHQPSTEAFLAFDSLLLLAKGKLCYRGPVSGEQPLGFFRDMGYACPEHHSTARFAMELLTSPEAHAKLHAALEGGALPLASVTGWRASAAPLPHSKSARASCSQLLTLFRRHLRAMKRDPALSRMRVGSNVVMGGIIGFMYVDLDLTERTIPGRIAILMFALIFMMLSSALPTVLGVHPELMITRKEVQPLPIGWNPSGTRWNPIAPPRSLSSSVSGNLIAPRAPGQVRNRWYDLRVFYASKLLSETPLLLLPPLLFLALVCAITNLHAGEAVRFGLLYVALLGQMTICHSFALLLSCSAPSLAVAVFLVPISLLPMLLFAGFFKNVVEIPWAMRWIPYIDPMTYAWEALAFSGFYELPVPILRYVDVPLFDQTLNFTFDGTVVLTSRLGMSDPSPQRFWTLVGIMAAYVACVYTFAFLALRRRVRSDSVLCGACARVGAKVLPHSLRSMLGM